VTLILGAPDPQIVAHLKLQAAKMILDGRETPSARRHIHRCNAYHAPTNTVILYTRDEGMHSSGWWKNPQFERCFHLSLSFAFPRRDRPPLWERLPFDHKMGRKWAEEFFGDNAKLLWLEGPLSAAGKSCDVHHYRLFCDPSWNPIFPKGEVYSRDWTPAGWKSWSEVHGSGEGDNESVGSAA
jgi:hypothetical protein